MRRDKMTLIATTSPLVLEKMDHIFVVVDGRALCEGTHQTLLASSAEYRQIVLREESR
jgi:ABC-type multidrug transport system fused ATPase/permease subunit